MSDNLLRQRSHAQFRKLPGVEDGKTIMSEYEAGAAVVAAKTARLKELRLARDAAEQAAPPKAVPVKNRVKNKKKTAGRTKKRPAVSVAASLTDWLKNRHVGGHNH
jgi:hypothetical protein